MKTEEIIIRLQGILIRNNERDVNKLIPEDIKQIKTIINELNKTI
jgi:hypothetical protein